jgi:phosphoesterase RecJ-like protein
VRNKYQKNLEKLERIFQEQESFVVTTHKRPDGDALGSLVAMALYLQKKGKKISVYYIDHIEEQVFYLAKEGIRNLTTQEF